MEHFVVENKPVSRNFIERPITSDHYVLGDGNIEGQSLMPDGHGWSQYLPLGETQLKNGIDPSSCPAGGTLNAVEAIGKYKYGSSFQSDLSERYLSIISGMDGHGGDPHHIAEVMRTIAGAIPEVFLPFDSSITTLGKYFSPRPITYALFKTGWHWHQVYDFKHQWLFYGDETLQQKQTFIKLALRYSPVGVAGYAWSLHSDGKYYNDGPPVHWFTVFDYVEGDFWLAFDTYPPYVKKLDWNYNFAYAKGYSLNRYLHGDTPDEPTPCKLQYCMYLLNWFISNFKKS